LKSDAFEDDGLRALHQRPRLQITFGCHLICRIGGND
jgi:hypothetical protein